MSSSELAEKSRIGHASVSKVLKLLNEASLIESARGAKGGYRVMLSPASVTVADVIRAMEGELSLTLCSNSEMECRYAQDCRLRGNWQAINDVLLSAFNSITFEHMCDSLSAKDIQNIVMSCWSQSSQVIKEEVYQ